MPTAFDESPGGGPQSVGSFKSITKSASPGVAGTRVDYRLHEKVVSAGVVLDRVIQARAAVKDEYDPDILGLKGARWDGHTGCTAPGMSPSKWTRPYSDLALSNMLSPQNISNKDFRRTQGTTHSPAKRDAAFDRGTNSYSGGKFGGWNTSTSVDAAELKSLALATEAKALESTAKIRADLAGYRPPVQQQEDVVERVRTQKKMTGIDMKELTAKYGPEGAIAMRDALIMRRAKGIDNPDGTLARRPQFGGRTRLDDIEAVKGLRFGGHLDEDDLHDADGEEDVGHQGPAGGAGLQSQAGQGQGQEAGEGPPAE